MEKEPRKSSEILLELEAKIDVLMSIVRTQDLNIKVLSNKINTILDKTLAISPASIKIEAVDTMISTQPNSIERQIPISPDTSLLMEDKPNGFRRTSRPETYNEDSGNSKKSSIIIGPKFPMQLPKLIEPEVIVPKEVTKFIEVPQKSTKTNNPTSGNIVPVMQRIVDKNGKSVFLADVEILQIENKQIVSKTRTNGAGKWTASLPIGQYRIFIRKRESLNKEKLEIMQDIQIDGSTSPLELKSVIIK